MKFNGTPWSYVDKVQSCTARLMMREIIAALTKHSVILYGNTNLKSTADTLFFRYDPLQTGTLNTNIYIHLHT